MKSKDIKDSLGNYLNKASNKSLELFASESFETVIWVPKTMNALLRAGRQLNSMLGSIKAAQRSFCH